MNGLKGRVKIATGILRHSTKDAKNSTERIMQIDPNLEDKWWHRLAKAIIWLVTVGIAVISLLIIFALWSPYYEAENYQLLLFLLVAPIVYGLLWVFYTKVILYIVYGRKSSKNFWLNIAKGITSWFIPLTPQKKKKFTIGILAIIAVGIIANWNTERMSMMSMRDMRFRLFKLNLAFVSATEPREFYGALIGDTEDEIVDQIKGVLAKQVKALEYVQQDIGAFSNECSENEICEKHLRGTVDKITRAAETMMERYKSSGAEVGRLRELAFQMSRSARIDDLIPVVEFADPYSAEQIKELVDPLWEHELEDLIFFKDSCDRMSPIAYDSGFHDVCEEDLFRGMMTFYFEGEDTESRYSGLATVCNLEKYHSGTGTCELTLGYAIETREAYLGYLAAHENPYYKVTPPKKQ